MRWSILTILRQYKRYRLYKLMGTMSYRLRQDYLQARQFASLQLEIAEQLEDKYLIGYALHNMGSLVNGRPQNLETELPLDEVLAFLEQAIALWQELGDLAQLAFTLNNKGQLLDMKGDTVGQIACYEQCIEIARQAGDIRRVYVNINNLAPCARDMGDDARAKSLAREALRLEREAGDRFLMACTINFVFDPVSEPEQSLRMTVASEVAFEVMGTTQQPGNQEPHQYRFHTARET